ncbi:30S ribosomal protein S20 [Candidatus Saccharibacteria bacterium]|nr:30S ribosomal protein S20 [Candidatus Saccharibacteria bacterium]MBI3338484.1 30S ribosomal protein S20 [Candidatus Saccharibacteria bacterium]
MPIIKSAKKRVRVARKATIRNVKTKRSIKLALKSFQAAITSGGKKTNDSYAKVQSALDKAAKKGVMHKNKVARKKKQLAAKAKAATNTIQTTTKKPVAKKPITPKKTTPKKPVAKKVAKS